MTLVNHERLGRIAPLISLPHGCVRGLNVVCEPRRVEQGAGGTASDKLGAQGVAPRGIDRQSQGHDFVVGPRPGDEFGQPA